MFRPVFLRKKMLPRPGTCLKLQCQIPAPTPDSRHLARRAAVERRWNQGRSVTLSISAQYVTKLKAPGGRKSSAGALHPSVLRGLDLEQPGDGVELVLGQHAEVGAFGQVLPQQTVGVFRAAALPRAMRMSEGNGHAGLLGNAVRACAAPGACPPADGPDDAPVPPCTCRQRVCRPHPPPSRCEQFHGGSSNGCDQVRRRSQPDSSASSTAPGSDNDPPPSKVNIP